MPIRIALDSDALSVLDDSTDFVITYSDLVSDFAAEQQRFSRAQLVLIDRGNGDPTDEATVIDVETGSHRPADAPAWYDRKLAAGKQFLTVYCNRSTLPAVDGAMGPRHFWRWVATLDGTVHIDGHEPMRSPALVQCLGAAALGIHADLSLVLEDGWRPAGRTINAGLLRQPVQSALSSTQHATTVLRDLLAQVG